ncbi:MAG TPA: helix-turn-helix transcriptional regulator [Burkholderiales bacterium]|nr:helix-turn-helix transcriptional regulator [Burkholderiales bacterium]
MFQSARLVETLKKCLRTRGKTYADVARAVGLSEPSIKRMFSRGTFTLRRIEEILNLLEMDLFEVARMSRGMREGPVELALEQETALAKDERLLSVFWLLLNEWHFGEILEAYSIGRNELTLAFARLARLKLIDWGPGERTRLRVPKDFRWRAGGPVKKAYGRRVTQEFLDARFDAPLELLRFETREMSAESAAVLKRRLERVVAEFNDLAEVDAGAGANRGVGVALLVACRPWQFSVVNALKRRDAR